MSEYFNKLKELKSMREEILKRKKELKKELEMKDCKLKEVKSIREGLLIESNDFKNELKKEIFKELEYSFVECYNDLYSIKGGECRRLKGYVSSLNDDVIDNLSEKNKLDRENEKFNKIKDYLNNKDFGKYSVDICKLESWGWYEYKDWFMKIEGNWGKNWFDFKNEKIEKETNLIIKIKWKGVNLKDVV